MEWLVIVLCVILVPPILLVLRLLYKRLAFINRLKQVCKSCRYQLIPTHHFWWLGWTRGINSDFHVVTQDTIYSVKLIGSVSKRILFNFVDESNYSVRNLIFQFSVAAADVPYDAKKKAPYQFDYKLPNECITKRMMPVIVMNPVSSIVSVSTNSEKRKQVENGDYVNEGYFFTGTGFLEKLHESK